MSADTHGHADHGHGAHGHRDHGPGDHGGAHDEAAHGTYKSYWIGFLLSVVLTAIPFWLVMTMPFSPRAIALVIMAFAVAQIVVHMIFFLHMNRSAEGGWSLMALLFTIVIVGISLGGSVWVMYHMNTNMMPTPQVMEQM